MSTLMHPHENIIRQEIEQVGGWISFARFMELALYHPEWGYYNRNHSATHFTRDFITAPELSPLFGQCLANQIQNVLQQIENGNILELGAGSGVLAETLLRVLEKKNALPPHYYILEISPTLQAAQQERLRSSSPHLLNHVQWLTQLPESFSGIILANEVLDALPVHLFHITKGGHFERGVTWENQSFTWHDAPPSTPLLAKNITKLHSRYALNSGYLSEMNLAMCTLLQSLASCLQKGVIELIDYGYNQREYYHPERTSGTLMCFHQHHRQDNPLILVGLQDITAHVDFTRLAEVAIDAGLTLTGYTTQAAFLLECGLMEQAESSVPSMDIKAQYRQSQAIKRLILPSEMGELVKVISLTKNWNTPLLGVSFQDKRIIL